MAPFSRPEAVLKQAEHLITVHQQQAALQLLSELFTMKKFRTTALTALEPIVLRFVQLCVEMRKGRVAKEGLMQYKNIAQNSSVGSVEVVVKRFIQLAEEKVTEAKAQADKLYEEKMGALEKGKETTGEADLEVEDLEASETPERVLMAAIVGVGTESRERMDRALVTPWLKFLWEAYRTALETLKNNARLELIYQQIAQMAFQFCLTYQRKTEFRRLCDLLRLHLSTASKYSHQPHSINLSDPDTLQRHLDTRFAQLDAAIEMELWGEAFRSVEDVHHLLALTTAVPAPAAAPGAPTAQAGKKPTNLKQLSLYYEKLTKVFSPSSSSSISSADTSLFHAAAYARYFSTLRSLPNSGGKTNEELESIAGGVVLSALCVREEALDTRTEESEDVKRGGREGRLANLLGLNKLPTRRGLLKDAVARGILALCPAPIRELHSLLITPLSPHSLITDSLPVLDTLADPGKFEVYAAYLPHLPTTLLTHLLFSLSETYSEMFLENLLGMVDGWKGTQWEISREAVEGWLIGLFRRSVLRGRIDHMRGVVLFEDPEPGTGTGDELQQVASKLHDALLFIDPPAKANDESSPVFQALQAALQCLPATRAALVHKRALQQRRVELSLELTTRRTKEEAQSRLEKARAEKEEQERKEREETKKREQERIRREIESVRKGEQQKLVQELIARGNLKVSADDMENLDTQKLVQLQVEQIEKQKKELTERLRVIWKRIDHTERAFRKEERSLLEEDYIRQQEEDRVNWERTQDEMRKRQRQQFEEDVASKHRLTRMMDDYLSLKAQLEEQKKSDFEEKYATAMKKAQEEKDRRRAIVLKEREEEWKRIEEEERQQREEEEAARREEEERLREEEAKVAEEEAKREAAEAAKRRRAEEREREIALAKKRVEEEEARERAREERRRAGKAAPAPAPAPVPTPAPAVPAAAGDGGAGGAWRRGARPATPASSSPRETPPGPSPARPTPSPAAASAPGPAGLERGTDGRPRLRLAPRTVPRAEAPTPPQPSSPAHPPAPQSPARPPAPVHAPVPSPAPAPAPPPAEKSAPAPEDDGFTTVVREKPAVWTRGRGRGRGRGI